MNSVHYVFWTDLCSSWSLYSISLSYGCVRIRVYISFWYRKIILRQPVYPWQWQWSHVNWIYQKMKQLWAQFSLDVLGRIANCLMRPLLLKMISSLWHTRWCPHLPPRSGVWGEYFYYIISPTSPQFCNCDNCKCNQWQKMPFQQLKEILSPNSIS